jgi:hypothetical protein
MNLCLAEPVPASGGLVKRHSGLDFQGAMQLEKMGMAEDATVGFLKRQNLPSCSLSRWLGQINGLRSGQKRILEILAFNEIV